MRQRRKIISATALAVAAWGLALPADAKSRALPEERGEPPVFSQPVTQYFAAGSSYTACFVPGQDCEGLIVRELAHAHSSVLMQAYSFTSIPIAQAMIEAKERGVDVRAILDKSQRREDKSSASLLTEAAIPVAIDEKPKIAHNKIFIIDGDSVITGSFNFTKSAQHANAENLIVVRGDHNLAYLYTQNWSYRRLQSTTYQ